MLTQGFQNFNFITTPKGLDDFSGKSGKSNALSGMEGQFKSVLNSLMGRIKSSDTMDEDALLTMLNVGVGMDKKGMDLLSLLASNIKQDKSLVSLLTVDEKGLASLERLLTGLGFNKDQAGKFIESLKSGDLKTNISLTNLFSKLGEFIKDNDSGDELAISALPFLQSLLNGFDMKPGQVEAILNKAAKSGQGIDLDSLVLSLKQQADAQSMFYKGTAKTQNALLTGLNMGKFEGSLSLDDFARKLEALINEKHPVKASPESLAMAAKAFGEGIKQSKASSKGGVDISMMTPAGESENALTLGLYKSSLKQVQTMNRNKGSEASFSGSKNNMPKERIADAFKEFFSSASAGKDSKHSPASSKDGSDSSVFAAKTMAGIGLYEKLADSKAALPAEKTLPSYVTEQVTRQIGKAVKMGKSEITFQIKPPDLGRVQLSIESTHEGMKIRIVTEHHATRDMIMSQANDMRSMLADQGIRLDKIDVNVSGDFGQSLAQARQEAGQPGKEQKGKDKETFSIENTKDVETEEPELRRFKYIRGNLDLVA